MELVSRGSVSRRETRQRKVINYAEITDKETSSVPNESVVNNEETVNHETSTVSSNTEENDTDEDNEYELLRKRNLEEHEAFLRQLDFSDFREMARESPKTSGTRKRKASIASTERESTARRTSLRLRGITTADATEYSAPEPMPEPARTVLRNDEMNIPMLFESNNRDISLFSVSSDKSEESAYSTDLATCSLSDYRKIIRCCKMWSEPTKIIVNRITCLSISACVSKIIAIVGDTRGNLSLVDLKSTDRSMFEVHSMQVNCVTFSKNDESKLYSTSHEGIIRRGDINARVFEKIYSTSDKSFENQDGFRTTWHDEFENILYIAVGNGEVSMLDLRSNKVVSTIKCHQRSVRTVQHHPSKDNCFLTASGLGEIGIWDTRNMRQKGQSLNMININKTPTGRGKGLTSAFFSHTGNFILATCNDDFIRIYDTNDLQKTREIQKMVHNNHTGRWLSVFKAQWLPHREDAFYVGSMLSPKRIQIFATSGHILHNLTSEFVTTYCPVVTVHPTLPIYLGGNSSGRIHLFSPNRDLSGLI